MAFFRHLGLLLWKDLIIQSRKVCMTFCQIFLPVLFAAIFLGIRFPIDVRLVPGQSNRNYRREVISQFAFYLQYRRTTLYTPNNTLIDDVISHVKRKINFHTHIHDERVRFVGFASSKDMLDYYSYHSEKVNFAIDFKNVKMEDTTLPRDIRYALRPPVEYIDHWLTEETAPFVQSGLPTYTAQPAYESSGFMILQRTIDEAIINYWKPSSRTTLHNLNISLQMMPEPGMLLDPMIPILQTVFPVFLMLSFIFLAVHTTKQIVYEKEKKLKESMKLMGLSAGAHWASWFIYSFIYVVIIMALFAIFCGVDASGNGAPLVNGDPSLFFVFLICYGVAIITYCFMISVFVQRANVGAAISGICFFISYCPYFYLHSQYQRLTRTQKLACCLDLNLGMAFGAYVIALYEGTGEGAQWSNISHPASLDDNLSLLDAILMLLLDTFLHLLVTWYVDNVRPGEFGVPKPWYFPFTRTYWCGNRQKEVKNPLLANNDENHFEKDPTGLDIGISIQKLTKVFGSGGKKKVAVDGMSLNMYQDQISVLLGHNGAGKTTTMSMLTGFIPATGGTAMVNGYDINTDIQSVRESLGLCPQHNILFDTLTVKEHLEFFASLKGCPRKKVNEEVTNTLQDMGLQLKKDTLTHRLSGGQKRKLSVGIALIAGSKIVILDEPTSGMDPAARRQTWDILQRNRKGRTMLLTTHFMDEADLLGDRIAIMAEGVVKCCGTSYFLKKLYGAGYHLVMVKEPTCKVPTVTSLVTEHIQSAMMESEINAEISYLLPNDQSDKFAGLFTELEKREEELGITSFGTSATTMEEVFLRVENDDHMTDTDKPEGTTSGKMSIFDIEGESGNVLEFNQGFRKSTGLLLHFSRFRGVFIKKCLHSWRNKTLAIIQLFLPVLFTLAALAISKVKPYQAKEVPLTLDLSPFREPYISLKDENSSMADYYRSQFSGSSAIVKDITKDPTTYFFDEGHSLGRGAYNKKMVIGAYFEGNQNITGYYNSHPFHSQPICLSYIMNSVLQHFTSSDFSLTTINDPLPFNATAFTRHMEGIAQLLGFSVAFCMLFGMAFLTSSFIYFLVKERQVGAKHLQTVSGVGPFVFWMANFLWDFINFLIPSLLLLVVFAAFQSPAYVDDGRLGLVFLLLLVYGMAVLPYMYLFQFLFKSPATGVVVAIIFNIVTGLATLLTSYMLNLLKQFLEDMIVHARDCNLAFSILFPHYNFGQSIVNIFTNHYNQENCIKDDSGKCRVICMRERCIEIAENYLAWDQPGIGRHIFFMLIQCAACLLLVLMIEYHLPQRIWYLINPSNESSQDASTEEEQADVANERERVKALDVGTDNSDALVLKNLCKRYGNFVAVDHLSVGIPEKECFGLLGQNGAGKTTTFKMLTGELMVTGGNAHLWSYDVKKNIQKMQENMGYCPQFDALIDQMTGRETLAMYARLKGIPESAIKDVCKHLLDIMMLRQHADKPTSDYSGGNKRKLSTAIALVGDPAFIMLDEPSTGMDPKARRQLWNVLSKVRECNRTLLLTSHSMEECDALCTRLAIMVNGRFRCLGTPQHLKSTFGQGYTLIARMATVAASSESPDETAPASSQPLIEFIMTTFPNSRVFDDHQGYVHFQVPDSTVKLAQIFTLMEQAKVKFFVEDYSVHQTTLEQIFLSFVRDQIPPKEDKRGSCKKICCCCCKSEDTDDA